MLKSINNTNYFKFSINDKNTKRKECKTKATLKTLKSNNPSKWWKDNNFSMSYLYPHSKMPPCTSHRPSIAIGIHIISTVVSAQSLSLLRKLLISLIANIKNISVRIVWWLISTLERNTTLNFSVLMRIVRVFSYQHLKRQRSFLNFSQKASNTSNKIRKIKKIFIIGDAFSKVAREEWFSRRIPYTARAASTSFAWTASVSLMKDSATKTLSNRCRRSSDLEDAILVDF